MILHVKYSHLGIANSLSVYLSGPRQHHTAPVLWHCTHGLAPKPEAALLTSAALQSSLTVLTMQLPYPWPTVVSVVSQHSTALYHKDTMLEGTMQAQLLQFNMLH